MILNNYEIIFLFDVCNDIIKIELEYYLLSIDFI